MAAGTGARYPAQPDDQSSGQGEGVLVQSLGRKLREVIRRHREAGELGQRHLAESDDPAIGLGLWALGFGLSPKPAKAESRKPKACRSLRRLRTLGELVNPPDSGRIDPDVSDLGKFSA